MTLYFSSTSFRQLLVKTNRNYGQRNTIKLYILIKKNMFIQFVVN